MVVRGLDVLTVKKMRSKGMSSSLSDIQTEKKTGSLPLPGVVGNVGIEVCPICVEAYRVFSYMVTWGNVSHFQPVTFFCLFLAETWELWVLLPWTAKETWLTQPRQGAS